MLPSLREHLCYNRSGLSFVEELDSTELGHVFEHVMLAVLEQRGIRTSGQTTWNWHRDAIGTFHVTIATGKKLLIKESLLVAQAILTNLLIGPVLPIRVAEATPKRQGALPVYRLGKVIRAKPENNLLFAPEPGRGAAATRSDQKGSDAVGALRR